MRAMQEGTAFLLASLRQASSDVPHTNDGEQVVNDDVPCEKKIKIVDVSVNVSVMCYLLLF
jgi:hypothetical protein